MGDRGVFADPRAVARLAAFVARLAPRARANSLAQLLVKLTAPGVPDLYQGCELADGSLVDPDNRRPVDYDARRAALTTERRGVGDDLGLAKLWTIRRVLRLRRERPELFAHRTRLAAAGPHADRVFAFARGTEMIAAVPRVGRDRSRDAVLACRRDVAQRALRPRARRRHGRSRGAVGRFPVALLVRSPDESRAVARSGGARTFEPRHSRRCRFGRWHMDCNSAASECQVGSGTRRSVPRSSRRPSRRALSGVGTRGETRDGRASRPRSARGRRSPRAEWLCRRVRGRCRRRCALSVPARRLDHAPRRSGVAVSAGGSVRAVAGRRSERVRVDRRRVDRRPRRIATSSTSSTSARSRRAGTWAAACKELAVPRAARDHDDRADADRRMGRRAQLGLRRREPVRTASRAMARRTSYAASSIARTRSGSPSSSTSSTTTSAPPGTRCRVRTATSSLATATTGARRSTSRTPAVREFYIANAVLLDLRVPPRRPAPRRDARDPRRRREPHILAEIITRARARGAEPPAVDRRRERAAGRAPVARSRLRRAVERRLPPHRARRRDRRDRRLPPRLLAARRTNSSPLSATAFSIKVRAYPWQRNPRGTSTRGLARARFVHFLENHDQVANLGFGERLAELGDPGTLRALTALLLLTPSIPMLFQGQETGSRGRGSSSAITRRHARVTDVRKVARNSSPSSSGSRRRGAGRAVAIRCAASDVRGVHPRSERA